MNSVPCQESVEMRRMAITLVLLTALMVGCSTPHDSAPPSSEGVKKISFYSSSLKKTMQVDIYLPPDYDSGKRYPVLYLFHGKDGNADTWMNGAIGINDIANRLIQSGKIRPLIIVSPEIDNGYGINTALTTASVGGYNRGMYEDYIIRDLVPYIDRHYSTIPDKTHRYIGGLSMGGFAALHDAFLHPDMFSKVGVLSAALWAGELPDVLRWIYPDPSAQSARDPITIAEHRKLNGLSTLIIVGDTDPFSPLLHGIISISTDRSV
jgi:enterochelin esterase-like enzyme